MSENSTVVAYQQMDGTALPQLSLLTQQTFICVELLLVGMSARFFAGR